MSQTVKVTGEIKKMFFYPPTYKEQWARELVNTREDTYEPYDTYLEKLMDDIGYYTTSHVAVGEDIYEIIALHVDSDPEMNYCTTTPGDAYDCVKFEAMFHNGGTCWEEVVAQEIMKVEKEREEV